MGRVKTALGNLAANFVVGFAIGSLLRDRRTGLKAGLALAIVGVAGSLLLERSIDEETIEDLAAQVEEAADEQAA